MSGSVGLTQKERRLYDFVKGYLEANGCGPSHAEITAATGIGNPTYYMRRLAAKGLIAWQKGYARTTRLVG